MNTLKNQQLCICGSCKQELPQEAFYLNKKTQKQGNYCKECRKAASREHYTSDKCGKIEKNTRQYPVITRIEDREVRRALILHALQMVAESIQRKKRKRWAETDNEFSI